MKKFKTNEEIIASLKKGNKVYREKVAIKAGFKNAAEYIAHLSNKSNPNTIPSSRRGKKGSTTGKVQEKPVIHNVYILDASGSMGGAKLQNAIKGINDEVKKLQGDDTVNYTQTIVDFSDPHDIKTPFFKVPIKEMKEYRTTDRGWTALYQAMGETLERLLGGANGTDKVLVKVFTDGRENASRYKWNIHAGGAQVVARLIKDCENRGFTVTFVGTAGDVSNIVSQLKIDATNTLVHDNTASGVAASFLESTVATMSYASNVKLGKTVTRGFYKKIGKL